MLRRAAWIFRTTDAGPPPTAAASRALAGDDMRRQAPLLSDAFPLDMPEIQAGCIKQ